MFSCKVFLRFQSREICFKEYSRIMLATIYIHTHAHLDLRVWHFSPWILVLTLQYMQYKYILIFIPTWAPHKPLEVGKKKAKLFMPWWGSKNKTYIEWFESTTRGEGKLCFVFKILKCFSNWLDWRKMVIYFKLFHSSTAQSFVVDTLNPIVQVWLGMVLYWCLVPRLCLK